MRRLRWHRWVGLLLRCAGHSLRAGGSGCGCRLRCRSAPQRAGGIAACSWGKGQQIAAAGQYTVRQDTRTFTRSCTGCGCQGESLDGGWRGARALCGGCSEDAGWVSCNDAQGTVGVLAAAAAVNSLVAEALGKKNQVLLPVRWWKGREDSSRPVKQGTERHQ